MDSHLIVDIRITHDLNLPLDAQGIADAVGRLLTETGLGVGHQDPVLLATARLQSAAIVHYEDVDPSSDPNYDPGYPDARESYGAGD